MFDSKKLFIFPTSKIRLIKSIKYSGVPGKSIIK